jgi:ABC-type transport system involved in multi-copper enzyme maturation permease subunit
MIPALKAEFRKLSSVRSTYFITLITLGIVALVAGYGNGYRANTPQLHNPGLLANESTNAVLFVGVLVAIVGLLLLAHEYRYNSILYTLTSSNSRVKSLLAKVLMVTVFAIIVTALITFFSPLCTIIGVHIAGNHLVAQQYPVWPILWQCIFVGWGYAMYAFILTAIIRSQVGSIVTFLLVPLIGEHIIMSIFRNSEKYLPFNNLESVLNSLMGGGDKSAISTAHAITVSCIYIAVGLLVSFTLFARRDAN